MGILAPLFLAGMAGLALPVLFHLVRRVPRGRQVFSSLMFLSPTPPRLTRRSRLDQWLLLLLRLLALAAIAFAFSRPFLRESAILTLNDLPRRRVAILVDNSASMQRGNLWAQVRTVVARQLDEYTPRDDVALFAFSDQLEAIVPFRDGQAAIGDNASLPSVEVARRAVASLEPTWGAADLGTALSSLASELDAATDVQQASAEPHIVVVSDLASGSRLTALQAFEWPRQVRLTLVPVAPEKLTNATLHLLANSEDEGDAAPRFRVVNAANSTSDQFRVRWVLPDSSLDAGKDEGVTVYVPPGQSRVVKLPRPADRLSADRVELQGDDHEFDNTFFVVPPVQQKVTVAYLGEDAPTDAGGLQFFLRGATSDDPLRATTITNLSLDELVPTSSLYPALAVVTKGLDESQVAALRAYVEQGGYLLAIPGSVAESRALTTIFDSLEVPEDQPRAREGDFALLAHIDFTHPCFLPFALPRYSDFTKVHFWQHLKVHVAPESTCRVVARFDDDSPWLIERQLGKGRALLLTCGWRPDDSQFALSSKFLPFIGGLLDLASGTSAPLASVTVNTSLPIDRPAGEPASIQIPSGEVVTLAPTDRSFTRASHPGIYAIAGSENSPPRKFAVNLDLSESDTSPLDVDQLEQWGVPMGETTTRVEQLERMRQQRDSELESRQQVWRWLLVGCLGLLIAETWIAGIAGRNSSVQESGA